MLQTVLFDREALDLGSGLDGGGPLDLLLVEDGLAEVLALADLGDELVFLRDLDLALLH